MSLSDPIINAEINDRVYCLNKNQSMIIVNDVENDVPAKQETNFAVPMANVQVLEDNTTSCFKMPGDYYVYSGKEVEAKAGHIEYDIDREDIVWMKLANERRKLQKEKQLNESLFEQSIDLLEKESYFQILSSESAEKFNVPQIDEDAPCCICNDSEDSNVNQILFCDMCNIAVHQECYGVPYIPEGQWLCRRCQLSPSVPVKCILCTYTSGAFKQTSNGYWAHVICALWLNEVHFANTVFLEPIEGVENALKRRHKLRCLVCKQMKIGACLQCSKKSCTRSFHVTCAYFAGMHMTIKHENATDPENAIINRYVYCHEHTPQSARLPASSMASWKRKVAEQIKKARKQVNSQMRDDLQISIPVIPQQKLDEIKRFLKLDKMEDIYYYWTLKRRSRCGVPLIRRLQVYHNQKAGRRSNEFDATSGNVSAHADGNTELNSVVDYAIADARCHSSTSCLSAKQFYLLRLRSNLERVRLLCELVKKREKFKREFLNTTEGIFEKCMKPVHEIMVETLEKFIAKDYYDVFTQPVSEEEVPGYHAIIKHPMDFQTMGVKLRRGEYKRIADVKADFMLIMENCASFNRENEQFLTYGHRIRRIGQSVIKAAEREEARINSSNYAFDYMRNMSLLKSHDLDDVEEYCVNPNEVNVNKEKLASTSTFFDVKSVAADSAATKSAANPSRKRKLKIDDFFIPSSVKTDSANIGSSSFSPASKQSKYVTTATTSPSTAYFRRNVANQVDSLTETSSADDDPFSMDDEEGLVGQRPTVLPQSEEGANKFHRQCVNATSAYQPRRTGTKPIKYNGLAGKQRHRNMPKRLSCNEFDSTNPSCFSHNDIVWVRLDKDHQMPARVIDLRMRIHLDDFPVDRALQLKPNDGDGHHTLIMLFDLMNTWKWIPTDLLKPCDITELKKNLPSSLNRNGDALQRAKQFWKEIIHGS